MIFNYIIAIIIVYIHLLYITILIWSFMDPFHKTVMTRFNDHQHFYSLKVFYIFYMYVHL